MGKLEISVYFCNFEMFILSAFELQPTFTSLQTINISSSSYWPIFSEWGQALYFWDCLQSNFCDDFSPSSIGKFEFEMNLLKSL